MPTKRSSRLAAVLACVWVVGYATSVLTQTTSDIVNTKHNLSVSGPGTVRASSETRICVFCHTPHNATPSSPLWNKDIQPQVYTVYTSPTLRAGPLPQPTGPTKLCLSCHDGTIAMGAVVNPAGGITMAGGGTLPSQSLSNFGLDLSGHHPVSFPYHQSLPNAELVGTPPADLTFGSADEVHCTTCHDPHKDAWGKFLVKDNRYSALCTSCHQIEGWPASVHATSSAPVIGILPRPPKTFPSYATLGEWGCETCHTPHFAPTAEKLLNFTAGPPPFSCTSTGCHAGTPGPPHLAADGRVVTPPDIGRQVKKLSAHHEVEGGAACADCHNPHVGTGEKAEAPYVSGMLRGVSGVDRNAGILRRATYEYEVCFKCHADANPGIDYVSRVVPGTNMRLAFAEENPSFHPVVAPGRNPSVPSIPSSFEPKMTPSEQIYCTACHADDEGGSGGPHGSRFRPILKERYDTADNTPQSFDSYALCYRCHDQASILRDDSFRKATFRKTGSGGGHSGHLAAGAPCSACHDPHGVDARAGQASGSHTHLINFDVRIVQPAPGRAFPVFDDTGTFSGGCTLVCHGVAHEATSYP